MFVYKLLIALIFALVFSLSPFYKLFRIQSDKKIRKSENENFAGNKSLTQWWYFDCVLEDGSVLVFLYAPYQWWSEGDSGSSNKSLLYFSCLDKNGLVTSEKKVFDISEVEFGENFISSTYFSLKKSHEKNNRNYQLDISLDEIKGSLKINSVNKAFSPFPGGDMGRFATKYILKLDGEDPIFRYASHVPEGKVQGNISLGDSTKTIFGKVYHEQGMFRGLPHQMGNGWAWFHFVSDRYNIFGTPEEFFCMQKDGEKIIGGITLFNKGCVLSDKVYDSVNTNLIVKGKMNFESSNLSFNIESNGKSKVLVSIPSSSTDQLWGTVAQPSTIKVIQDSKLEEEEGWLFIETCKMGL